MCILKEFYNPTRLRLKSRYAFLVGWRGRGKGRKDLGAGAGETSLVSLAGQLLVVV